MPPDPMSDPAIRAAIDALPAELGYDKMAAVCAEKFGERAPTADQIRQYMLCIRSFRQGRPSSLSHDHEVLYFIRDHIGLRSPADLFTACKERFGSRAPRRSSFYRHLKRLREQLDAPKR